MAEARTIYMAKNVSVLKWDALSVPDQIRWIRELMQCELENLSELRTGAVYCQIIHRLYPNAIRLNQVKLMTRFEADFEQNFAILEKAFKELNIRQKISLHQLIKGRGHIEFVNWLHKFYKVNNRDRYYDPVKERGGQSIGLSKNLAQPSKDFKQYFQRSATLDAIPYSFHIQGTITRSRSSNSFGPDGEDWAIKLTTCEPIDNEGLRDSSSNHNTKTLVTQSQSTQAEFDWEAAFNEQQKFKNTQKQTEIIQHKTNLNQDVKYKTTETMHMNIKHKDQFKNNISPNTEEKSTQAEFDLDSIFKVQKESKTKNELKHKTTGAINKKIEHKTQHINDIFSNTEQQSTQGDIKWDTYFQDWKKFNTKKQMEKVQDINALQPEGLVPDIDEEIERKGQSGTDWTAYFKDWKQQAETTEEQKQDENPLNQDAKQEVLVSGINTNISQDAEPISTQSEIESDANRTKPKKNYTDKVKEHAALRKENAEIFTTLSEMYEIAFKEGDDAETARRKLMKLFENMEIDQVEDN